MPFFKVFDYWNQSIIAYDDTWAHATARHPELVGHEGLVMQSLVTPVLLIQSDTSMKTHLYVGTVIAQGIYGGEHAVSVVRLEGEPTKSRIWVTGYFTGMLPQGKTLWKQS